MSSVRLRRVEGRWPVRRRYEVELRDSAGGLLRATKTTSPTGFLVKTAGVDSTDSWDWVRAADEAFANGSGDWVTDPFKTPDAS